jgi:hypothetical protein
VPNLASAREEFGDFLVSPYAGLCRPLPAFAAPKGQKKGNVPTQTPGCKSGDPKRQGNPIPRPVTLLGMAPSWPSRKSAAAKVLKNSFQVALFTRARRVPSGAAEDVADLMVEVGQAPLNPRIVSVAVFRGHAHEQRSDLRHDRWSSRPTTCAPLIFLRDQLTMSGEQGVRRDYRGRSCKTRRPSVLSRRHLTPPRFRAQYARSLRESVESWGPQFRHYLTASRRRAKVVRFRK